MQEILAFFSLIIFPILNIFLEFFSGLLKIIKFLKNIKYLESQEVMEIPNDTYFTEEDFIMPWDQEKIEMELDLDKKRFIEMLEGKI